MTDVSVTLRLPCVPLAAYISSPEGQDGPYRKLQYSPYCFHVILQNLYGGQYEIKEDKIPCAIENQNFGFIRLLEENKEPRQLSVYFVSIQMNI